jgi:integrase
LQIPIAKDVCESLGYASNNRTTIFSNVPEEWKGSKLIATHGGIQQMQVLTEKGLYFFLGRSDKKKYLFLTQYDTPYMTSDDIGRYYWEPCLKALGIRKRTVYHMRHTFACMMLNNNMPPNWIAKRMLGHKNTNLLFKTYGNYWSGQTP